MVKVVLIVVVWDLRIIELLKRSDAVLTVSTLLRYFLNVVISTDDLARTTSEPCLIVILIYIVSCNLRKEHWTDILEEILIIPDKFIRSHRLWLNKSFSDGDLRVHE